MTKLSNIRINFDLGCKRPTNAGIGVLIEKKVTANPIVFVGPNMMTAEYQKKELVKIEVKITIKLAKYPQHLPQFLSPQRK